MISVKGVYENGEVKLKEKISAPGEVPVIVTFLEEIEDESEEMENTLVDFFQDSPLYDSGIELERDKDLGREIEL
jgi:hypothetical protein